MDYTSDLKKIWDPVWESVYQSQEWGKYPGESLIQFIAQNYYSKDRTQTKLLEVGCGPASNIWYLSREGFDAYGIDGSDTAIEKGNNRLASERLFAKLIVGDIIKLPYEDNFFDGVLDVECLYCMNTSNTNIILSEIKRILKPGGLFYSRTFSDSFFIGKNPDQISKFEYQNVYEGPQANRGFIRLIDKVEIVSLYGNHFNILSVDKLIHTRNNEEIQISEWVIICKNDE
jgi:SAM-dependent methyltransferase